MKVAYIGNFLPEYSTENDVRKAFEHLGHNVVKIQENQTPYPTIQRLALEADMLLITSTWDNVIPFEIWMALMKDCALKGIPTITLHLDVFWNIPRNSRKWWLNPMLHTAYIFTADGDHDEEWKALGKNHFWLPPAVRHDAAHFGKYQEEYACDVAFVGSNGIGYHEDVWPYRKELVDKLWDICSKNGWVFRNPGGEEQKINRDEDMNNFYSSAKVTVGDSLCLSRENSKYWSDRVPEATGRGGFLIMPEIDALEKQGWLIPQYKWSDWKDLESQIARYLKEDQTMIREHNQQVTSERHTYVNRVKTILSEVGL